MPCGAVTSPAVRTSTMRALGPPSMLKMAEISAGTADDEVATATANRLGPRVHSADSRAPPPAAKVVDVVGATANVSGGAGRGLLPPVDTNAPSTAAAPSAAVPTTAIGRIRRRLGVARATGRRLPEVRVGGDDEGDAAATGGGGGERSGADDEGGTGPGATGCGATGGAAGGGNGATRSAG